MPLIMDFLIVTSFYYISFRNLDFMKVVINEEMLAFLYNTWNPPPGYQRSTYHVIWDLKYSVYLCVFNDLFCDYCWPLSVLYTCGIKKYVHIHIHTYPNTKFLPIWFSLMTCRHAYGWTTADLTLNNNQSIYMMPMEKMFSIKLKNYTTDNIINKWLHISWSGSSEIWSIPIWSLIAQVHICLNFYKITYNFKHLLFIKK